MKNKVLVELYVPDIEEKYSVWIPVNKKIGNIILLLDKAIREMNNNTAVVNDNNALYNRTTGTKYQVDVLLRDTDIRSGTKLVLL